MTRVTDGQGGWTTSWATFAEVWAKIEPKSARQNWKTDKLEHGVSHIVTIRNLDDVTSEMRILFDDRYLHIRGHRIIDEKRFFMELNCEEGEPS
jgi:SPP1 family predicted phage head-tail adaptor